MGRGGDSSSFQDRTNDCLHPAASNAVNPIPLREEGILSLGRKTKLVVFASFAAIGIGANQRIVFAQQAEIPLWQYSIVAPSNSSTSIGKPETYKGYSVGSSPLEGTMKTTTVTVGLIPVRLTFPARPAPSSGGYPTPQIVFDPTQPSCVDGKSGLSIAEGSPVFNDSDYAINGVNVGRTQYVDAFERANFWQDGRAADYHLLFKLKVLPKVDVTVPLSEGSAFEGGCFENNSLNLGNMQQTWFDGYVRKTLLPGLIARGVVNPEMLPVFYLDTAAMTPANDPEGAVYNYHYGMDSNGKMQFYSVVTFNADGTTPPSSGDPAPDEPLADELVNWVSDPYNNNQTPAWGWVGYELGCYSGYLPSYPLAGDYYHFIDLNDHTYTMTEQTFFSWFFDQTPSIAAGKVYSDHGALRKPASAQGCTFVN